MPRRLSDRKLLEKLIQKIGARPQQAQFDKQGHLTFLAIYGFDLQELPPEIYQFTHLRILSMPCNQLTTLPPEIGQLTNLARLELNHNRLSKLPPEVGQLTELERLILDHNQLTALPEEIGNLTHLQHLSAGNQGISYMPKDIQQQENWQTYTTSRNQIKHLPLGFWKLTSLTNLELWGNQISSLPPEIGQLTNLEALDVGHNDLISLPAEIGNLLRLEHLHIQRQPLSTMSSAIRQLTNLKSLSISVDEQNATPPTLWQFPKQLQLLNLQGKAAYRALAGLRHLKSLRLLSIRDVKQPELLNELWQLTQLQRLGISRVTLPQLPPKVGQLVNLTELRLIDCQLRHIPPEIGQLIHLEKLDLRHNHLRQLPPELGQLSNLKELQLDGNPELLTPPPEVVARGTDDILAFLRELQRSSVTRYEAKLLVVGEGGTGKSSLLRALRNEQFEQDSPTTHGIEVDQLALSGTAGTATLHTWDFGGQHIYHATHQFFLTKRSLYLVTWNARLGVEQGRLHYWLETIKALAPDAPILLVATHIDERAPDLNYQQLAATYPQLAGQVAVSNKSGAGLADLQQLLLERALALPLMGQPWPENWLNVEQALQARAEHHISADAYLQCCSEQQVEENIASGTLGEYLHDLGKILYFRDDYLLCNLVVLKPNWITKAISLVLTDEEVRKANGILRHADLTRIWVTDESGQPYEQHLYPIFLRLMERFDLSYQIEGELPGAPSTASLVPQLLPYQPPLDLPPWPKSPPPGQTQVEMIYRFDFVPSGIMSWFIVRTHRYTRHLHWREGVLLEYQNHQARVELNPMQRELRLLVWGVQPHNFFTILMNTVDLILARFQGLAVRREIPCICHWYQHTSHPCPHFYSYTELIRRMEARRHKVECARSFTDVSVPMLLYGIHTSTDSQVVEDIRRGQQKIEQRLDDLQKLDVLQEQVHQLSELFIRNFTRMWNLEMQKLEADCPGTFYLTLGSTNHFHPKNWISQEYRLYLVCQHPPGPHSVGDGYALREAEEWWIKINPWLNHVLKFLKFGIPLGQALGAVYDEVAIEHIKADIGLMNEIVQHIPESSKLDTLSEAVPEPDFNHQQRALGSALRALHSFLREADPSCTWGGLRKTLTPDGNILWLCAEHRQQFEARPLTL